MDLPRGDDNIGDLPSERVGVLAATSGAIAGPVVARYSSDRPRLEAVIPPLGFGKDDTRHACRFQDADRRCASDGIPPAATGGQRSRPSNIGGSAEPMRSHELTTGSAEARSYEIGSLAAPARVEPRQRFVAYAQPGAAPQDARSCQAVAVSPFALDRVDPLAIIA